ncbi:MAG: hypothetical protein AB7U83_01110 [Vicinamibacterales bacterium]
MMKMLGVVLVVVGLVLAGSAVWRLDQVALDSSAAVTTAAPGPLVAVVLPLTAAICFASGIVLLVVGSGRWSQPRRHPAPGDAIVDPEGHHKMDHV